MNCVFVRDAADLDRVCREVARLFAHRRRHDPARRPARTVAIAIGDEACGAALPTEESAGVAGVWTVVWLDEKHRDRCALFDALPRAEFVPVFGTDVDDAVVRRELRRLHLAHPGRVRTPAFQSPMTGRIELPSERSDAAERDREQA